MSSDHTPFGDERGCHAPVARSGNRLHAWLAALALALAACGRNDVVVADLVNGGASSQELPTPFGEPVLIEGLLDPTDEISDPTLSADQLILYFASPKNGDWAIWTSTRRSVNAPWAPAVIVPELEAQTYEAEPSLSGDGLTLWFSSNRPQSANVNHIWITQRATLADPWDEPEALDFGTSDSERGPSIDTTASTLVFYSDRQAGNPNLFLSTRELSTSTWGSPRELSEINLPAVDWDPGVYAKGLGLVFGSTVDGQSWPDLYESVRSDSASPFSAPVARTELNSLEAEGDPWLSDDGLYLVFASGRDGVSRLYEARRSE